MACPASCPGEVEVHKERKWRVGGATWIVASVCPLVDPQVRDALLLADPVLPHEDKGRL